ncbi:MULTISPECIES: hypothetical protein [unclassified Microcoleus]|uniref:hypothetical protein n=1 Tax=unclassified Microcoleus TaxID=2642155 RepID=UPI002FD747C7
MVSTHQPGISPKVQNKWAANYRQLLTRSHFFIFLIKFCPEYLSQFLPLTPAATNLGQTQAQCDRPIPPTL